MKLFHKKGFINQIKIVVIGIAVIAIVIAVGFVILAQMKSQTVGMADALGVTASGSNGENITAWNATNTMIQSLAAIPDWMPILILVLIGGLVVGTVMYFGKGRM